MLASASAMGQLAQPKPADTPNEPAGKSFARWLDDVQNLRVREAMGELGEHWTVVVVALSIAVLVILAVAGVFRPSGVGTPTRDVKPFPSIVWLFVGVLILFVGPMAADATGRLPEVYAQVSGKAVSLDAVELRALRMGAAALAGCLVGLAMVYLMSKSAKEAGLSIGGMDLLLGVGGFLLALPLVQLAAIGGSALMVQVSGQTPAPIAHETLAFIAEHREHPAIWGVVAAVGLGAPIVEEMVFRMGLQSALLRMFGNPWPAIIVTSLCFAGIHLSVLPEHSWHALIALFVLSMCLGVAFERTKRLGVPMTMHIAFNVLNIALAMQAGAQISPEDGGAERGETYVAAPDR